jgi:hypothetical protein
MELGPGQPDLTYCTSIHPAENWRAVFAGLRMHAPALKASLAPGAPFGIGLQLPAKAAEELLAGRLREFAAWLKRQGLYVALLNGCVHGPRHGERLNDQVFAPDWRDPHRLHYTLRLAAILSELLPEGGEGGISTIPLSTRRWDAANDAAAGNAAAINLVSVANALGELHARTGRLIHLDIEPASGGLIENTAETVAFFRDRLLPCARERGDGSGENPDDLIRRHIRVCYDACHFAVEYEDPRQTFLALEEAGIGIGRVQVSSALAVRLPEAASARKELALELRPLTESPYLRQVVERRDDGSLRSYANLPDALKRIDDPAAAEWRIHSHVPVFTDRFGVFGSTQNHTRETLRLAGDARRTPHLEIETYAWEVLPKQQRLDLTESIERECRWTWLEMCGSSSPSE